ncbi:Uma2 family endonuclease [Prauserella shujinwangii]|uniref:Uma2 family endonuclease n=1 Tax=Prauserella shujinwangii TaxID=1453103 RepID=A0A2T0M0Y0_9PSEU|nr:Uma2 family endonuclease [Prauserella shujinwangii]PRX50200.1 Uma2 family endonuclease [Prauserella shujinwangii]
MTALPEHPHESNGLLTITDYAALGETEPGYTELQEGRLVMSPSPAPEHNEAALALAMQLYPQVPADLRVVPDIDVDLELAGPDEPGFVRRPDLVVVRREGRDRVRKEGGLLRASDVVIVVEIVSPGSRRTDYVIKHGEYADAGIPHYWIVDLADPLSLVACHLAGELGYQDAPAATGTYTTTEPFPARLDLTTLS